MKKISKIITATVASLMVCSSLVYARNIDQNNYRDYDITLPSTGYSLTNAVTKSTDSTDMKDQVDYFGWTGSTVNSWVYSSKDGNLSARTDITKATGYTMRISQSLATEYVGNDIRLKLKTSTTTMHECDIRGTFYASY